MNQILTIAHKEFQRFFGAIYGYIILAIFLLGGALFLWIFPNPYNVLDTGYASLDGLFEITPYLFLFLAPAITMRTFAEERQQGTLELLITRPISKTNIVLGKMLGSLLIMLVALLLTLVWFYSIYFMAIPKGNVDVGAFVGSMLGLFFLSMIYISTGIFTSSLTDSQIFAFILAATLSFLFFKGFDFVSYMFSNGAIANGISSIGINYHYKSISRGVVDSRDLIYFIFITTIMVVSTVLVLRNLLGNKKN